MKQTVGFSQFVDAFHSFDRYEQFGYAALRSLFDYLEEYEESTGEEIELDVIALCCDYSVDNVENIASYYSIDIAGMDDDDAKQAVLDYLNDRTFVVDENCEGSILYYSAF